MKKARLDQILLRAGTVSEEQIQKALLRQKTRGGRLGTHLLFYRCFTEEELVQALAEQFQVEGVRLGDIEVPEDVAKKLPVNIAEEFVAIPFRYDRGTMELHVAIADPENPNALPAIRRASGMPNIVFHVAPEAVIRNKIAWHYHGRTPNPALSQVVDLPDLFLEDKDPPGLPPGGATARDGPKTPPADILMFTRQLFLKNVLPSLFERENLNLSVATSTLEIAESLNATRCRRILVSEDVQGEFERFASEHRARIAFPEVTFFRTVGSSLLENPAPYHQMYESLLTAIRHIADMRTPDLPDPPPYALISNDILEVGRSLGLGRMAIDGIRIATHLLVPSAEPAGGAPDAARTHPSRMFRDPDASLQIMKDLHFPWDIASCMSVLLAPPPGGNGLPRPMEDGKETETAAGLLALAWHRHTTLRSLRGGSRGDMDTLKSGLRHQAGHLAPSSVVEAYIRFLEKSELPVGADKDIFIVGDVNSLSRGLRTELKHHGFRIVETDNLREAQKIYLRRQPAAILIHVDNSLSDADRFCRHIREELNDRDTTLFAVTQKSEPSFLLNLLDTWFEDVLTLPVNSHEVVARITKALSTREKGTGGPVGQGFTATFKDLYFTDLVQTLGTGVKNVRMRVEHSSGKLAEIHFRQGRIVHAACGDVRGVEAVYEVIRWQEDGRFRIEPASAFPADNVSLTSDYILLEGSRLLDEHRART